MVDDLASIVAWDVDERMDKSKASSVDGRDLRGTAVDGACLRRKKSLREGWWARRTEDLVRTKLEGGWKDAGEGDL